LIAALKDDASLGGYRRSILRNILVVAQIGLSLVMLVVAGLVVEVCNTYKWLDQALNRARADNVDDLGLRAMRAKKERQFSMT